MFGSRWLVRVIVRAFDSGYGWWLVSWLALGGCRGELVLRRRTLSCWRCGWRSRNWRFGSSRRRFRGGWRSRRRRMTTDSRQTGRQRLLIESTLTRWRRVEATSKGSLGRCRCWVGVSGSSQASSQSRGRRFLGGRLAVVARLKDAGNLGRTAIWLFISSRIAAAGAALLRLNMCLAARVDVRVDVGLVDLLVADGTGHHRRGSLLPCTCKTAERSLETLKLE